LAIAGSILQNGQTITKVGPIFNINGAVVGGAASLGSHKTATPTAAALRTGKKIAAPAASSVGGSNRTAASAASVAGKK
jgi:hypothetical protein